MKKKQAANIITKWAKAWLEDRKMKKVNQETNPTSIDEIVDQELKSFENLQIKEMIESNS